jgi:hypothetical protein
MMGALKATGKTADQPWTPMVQELIVDSISEGMFVGSRKKYVVPRACRFRQKTRE